MNAPSENLVETSTEKLKLIPILKETLCQLKTMPGKLAASIAIYGAACIGWLFIGGLLIALLGNILGVTIPEEFNNDGMAGGDVFKMIILGMLVFGLPYLYIFCSYLSYWARKGYGDASTGLPPQRDLWKYIGLNIVLTLVFILLMIPVLLVVAPVLGIISNGSGTAGGILASLAGMLVILSLFVFLTMRAMLIFMASALGHEVAVGRQWRLTKGYVWKMLGICVLVALPVLAVDITITLLFGDGFLPTLISFILSSIQMAALTAFFAKFYGYMTAQSPAGATAA
jgi:hypothetical protein